MSDNLVKEEINVFDYELEKLIFRMKRQVLKVFLPFISFIHGFKKKIYNMLAFMLDPRYKSMRLVITYLGREVVVILVADYDE